MKKRRNPEGLRGKYKSYTYFLIKRPDGWDYEIKKNGESIAYNEGFPDQDSALEEIESVIDEDIGDGNNAYSRNNPEAAQAGTDLMTTTAGVAMGTMIAAAIIGYIIYLKYGQQIQSTANAVSNAPAAIASSGLSSLTSLFSSGS